MIDFHAFNEVLISNIKYQISNGKSKFQLGNSKDQSSGSEEFISAN